MNIPAAIGQAARAVRRNPSLLRMAFRLDGIAKFLDLARRESAHAVTIADDLFDARSSVARELARGVEYIFTAAVPGHIAEFGTMSGATACVLAKALATMHARFGYHDMAHGIADRSLFLFDSFAGFPQARGPIDMDAPHVKAGVWGAGVAKGLSPDQLLQA